MLNMHETTSSAITLSDLRSDIDDEPRVLDEVLASNLGMRQPRNVRQKIKENAAELQMHGSLVSKSTNVSKKGGRPGLGYYLNEPQALLICMWSNTMRAALVRKMLIDVFMQFRRQHLAPKSIKVQEHERRPSTRMDKALSLARSADRLEVVADKLAPIAPPNLCAMIIDGEPVMVDVNSYDLKGERAVVITWDGRLSVLEVDSTLAGQKFAGARSAHGPSVKSKFGTMRDGVVVVGRVVPVRSSATQIDLEPHYRGRKTLYRDDILRLIDDGLPNREIAQRTGACYQTVTHWRRWREDRMIAAE